MSKKMKMIAALVVSSLVIVAVAFAGTPVNLGYVAFKDMLRANHETHQQEGVVTFQLTLKDNGKEVIEVMGSGLGRSEENMSGAINIQAEGLKKELQLYGSEGQLYIYDVEAEAVYVAKHDEKESRGHYKHKRMHGYDGENQKFDGRSEAIFDYFMRDLAKSFHLVDGQDGSKDIVFELNQADMPAIVNIFASAPRGDDYGHGHGGKMHSNDMNGFPLFEELKQLKGVVPELVDQVVVSFVQVIFDRDDKDMLKGVSFSLNVSGLDEEEGFHNLEFSGQIQFDKTNLESIEPISLNGKTIYELPSKMD
jgi:hypothetical protein